MRCTFTSRSQTKIKTRRRDVRPFTAGASNVSRGLKWQKKHLTSDESLPALYVYFTSATKQTRLDVRPAMLGASRARSSENGKKKTIDKRVY